MIQAWDQWEGKVIAGAFPLQRYLGGSEDHAIFLTMYGEPESSPAVIKIVSGDPDLTEARLRRWKAAAELSHRHLLRILTLGRSELDGAPLVYMVMERADEKLSDVIPGRALSADEARQMLGPALSALSYIHAHGFIHGRLNPGQMMAAGDCFKIASTELRRAGESPSAPPDDYAPPEKAISPAGDIWSMGMILVEALAQHRPPRNTAGVDAIVPATLPQPFLEIARRALKAEPGSRATALELATLLQPVKRRTVRWRDAAAVFIALAVAAIAITPRLVHRPPPAPKTETPPAPAPARVRPQAPLPAPSPPAATSPAPSSRGEIIERVLPQVPAQASHTIQGRVRVNVLVHVDGSGRVAEASLESRGPSRYFAQLALQAARRWRFSPAADGSRRGREWILHFEFSRAGARVAAAPTGR